MELNFLDATARPSIDYVNLGTYMRYVMDEFERALHLKKLQKIGEQSQFQEEQLLRRERNNNHEWLGRMSKRNLV